LFVRKRKKKQGKREENVLFEFSSDDVREDFEFAMRVGAEAGVGGYAVFVYDAKMAELIVF